MVSANVAAPLRIFFLPVHLLEMGFIFQWYIFLEFRMYILLSGRIIDISVLFQTMKSI